MIDRSAISRAVAKAIAYAESGKHAEAADWGFQVILELDKAGIINWPKFTPSRIMLDPINRGFGGVLI